MQLTNNVEVQSTIITNERDAKVLLKTAETNDNPTKVYPKRWFILAMLISGTTIHYMQMLEYTIIENIVTRYYGVSSFLVELTATLFHMAFILMIIPVTYLMARIGPRQLCIIITLLTTLGTWVKVFSASPDRFVVSFVGQVIVASTHIIVASIPPLVTATWFPSHEIATATVMAYLGGFGGSSILNIVVPGVIRNDDNIETLSAKFFSVFLGIAMISTIVLVIILIFFQNAPKLPPSKAKAQQWNRPDENFIKMLRRIFKNKSFLLLCCAHAITVGGLNVFFIVINPLLRPHFENFEEDAGRLVLTLTVAGTFGSVVFGRILDRTKKFKLIAVFLYFFGVVAEIVIALAMYFEKLWAVYIGMTLNGVFMIGYMTIGFDICVEMTYPEPEGPCVLILDTASQFSGIIMFFLVNHVMSNYGDMAAHYCFIAWYMLGLLITLFTKYLQKRQEVEISIKNRLCKKLISPKDVNDQEHKQMDFSDTPL